MGRGKAQAHPLVAVSTAHEKLVRSTVTHRVSQAGHVALSVFADTFVVAVVVDVAVGRTPAFEAVLDSHQRGAL